MITKIIIAGFGGQGVIAAGKTLAYAAMKENKEVTYFPSYGAEMRGGTCNCSVIISDDKIANPIIDSPDIAIILNKPSKDKFEKSVKKGGIILINKTLVDEVLHRDDIEGKFVEATKIAEDTGSLKATNMVVLGAFSKISRIIKLDSLISSLKDVFPNFNDKLMDLNVKALKNGFDSIE